MKKSKAGIFALILAIIILFVAFIFRNKLIDLYTNFPLNLVKPEKAITDSLDALIQNIEKKISTPPPLKSEEQAAQSFLSRSGIIKWTNVQRQEYGLPPLKENLKLDSSAKTKVEDMFNKQYFEHLSPSGAGISDLVNAVGYEYILIGENLAMGNFESSEKLVKAWMDSLGHRENILNSKYTEIGVAVMENFYEGRKIWIAVQHFGLPMSYCPSPNVDLKAKINSGETQIDQLKNQLEVLFNEIQNMRHKTKEEIDLYNQKIGEYNSILSQYNNLVEGIKEMINFYNSEVQAFNSCFNMVK